MAYNKYTDLADGVSRSSSAPLSFIDNRTMLVESLEQATGLGIDVLIFIFLGCFAVFLILAIIKLMPRKADI